MASDPRYCAARSGGTGGRTTRARSRVRTITAGGRTGATSRTATFTNGSTTGCTRLPAGARAPAA
ncbi:MAG: hypothetical protein ABIS92_05035 [Polyangia bacterium]